MTDRHERQRPWWRRWWLRWRGDEPRTADSSPPTGEATDAAPQPIRPEPTADRPVAKPAGPGVPARGREEAPARRRADARSGTPTRRISLALQGGGSHGAFTWGVLDRLLQEPGLEIAAISGTSAGALNAAVLATGLHRGGRAGARRALKAFWHDVANAGAIFSPFSGRPRDTRGGFSLDALPGMRWFQHFFRAFSPYEFNPLNLNPLRDVARRHVDEAALRRGDPALFITATSVHTGQARVFTGEDLGIEALLASACLPFLFQAIEIDGEPYWDGGYSGNPALYPLIYDRPELDVVLVKINPLRRESTPKRTADIMERVSEITFNAGLIGELRAIDFVARLLREHRLDPGRYKALRLHMIGDDEGLAPFGAGSKLNTHRDFLDQLHGLGRAAADRFLARDGAAIGERSTLDIEADFLHPVRPAPSVLAREEG